jgi:hypothetical protein
MDSEMYGDFSFSQCERKISPMSVFSAARKNEGREEEILDQLEKVSSKLDSLEDSITHRIKQDVVLPMVTESSGMRADDSKIEEIDALLSDVEQLKQEMKDAEVEAISGQGGG